MSKLFKLILPILFISNAFANYTISPVKLVVTPENKSTWLEFKNDNDEKKRFQVSVLEVKGEGKKQVFEPSKELSVAPASFSLDPGKAQTIRVQSENIEAMKDRNFKIAIRELPSFKKPKDGETTVHLIPQFTVPVSLHSEKTSEEVKQN